MRKIFSTLFLGMLILGCSNKTCNIDHSIKDLKIFSDFDYQLFTDVLIEKLKATQTLTALNKESIVVYFNSKLYCNFPYNSQMKDTDTFFALSPSIGACVFSIVFANEEENEAFAHSSEPSTFLANILNSKDKDFFNENTSKYIVAYFTELLIGECQN